MGGGERVHERQREEEEGWERERGDSSKHTHMYTLKVLSRLF